MKRFYPLIIYAIFIYGFINATSMTAWGDSDSYYYPAIEKVGFIRKGSVPFVGTIHSSDHKQVLMTWNQVVYIKPHGNHVILEKDLFVVFQKVEDIYFKDQLIGNQYQIKGMIEINAVSPEFARGTIVKSFFPIRKGDRLKPYEEMNPNISITTENPDILAHIIATDSTLRMIGQGDIVFIDKGNAHGIRPGNMFDIYEHLEKDYELSRRTVFVDPTRTYASGRLLIIKTERETSAALITWSKNELLMAHQLDVR